MAARHIFRVAWLHATSFVSHGCTPRVSRRMAARHMPRRMVARHVFHVAWLHATCVMSHGCTPRVSCRTVLRRVPCCMGRSTCVYWSRPRRPPPLLLPTQTYLASKSRHFSPRPSPSEAGRMVPNIVPAAAIARDDSLPHCSPHAAWLAQRAAQAMCIMQQAMYKVVHRATSSMQLAAGNIAAAVL